MAILLKPGEVIEVVAPADGKEFSLEEVQQLVGGYVEMVRFPIPVKFFGYAEGPFTMALVNEEGKMKSQPVNYKATAMWLKSNSVTLRHARDVLVGDVLFVSEEEFQ